MFMLERERDGEERLVVGRDFDVFDTLELPPLDLKELVRLLEEEVGREERVTGRELRLSAVVEPELLDERDKDLLGRVRLV